MTVRGRTLLSYLDCPLPKSCPTGQFNHDCETFKIRDSQFLSVAEQEAGRGVKNLFKLFWEELKTGHKPPEPPTKR